MNHGNRPTTDERTSILVVDDIDDKLLVYLTILEDLGLNIDEARSGEEALAHVLKSEFAVILLDVQMPGMDGFETASLIRKRRRSMHTPIIFLTAFTDEVRTATGYAHGAVDYISTPVVPEILRAKAKVFVDLFRMTERVKRQADERIALAEERSRRAAVEDANRRLSLLARAGRSSGNRSITTSPRRTWPGSPLRSSSIPPTSSLFARTPANGRSFRRDTGKTVPSPRST
jgi:CheY-like chemotaxis protein